MSNIKNIHPGEVLSEEFLKPLKITGYKLAQATGMPQARISDIINRKRRISADSALRLAKFLGTTPQFWLGLQTDYDLENEQTKIAVELSRIPGYKIKSIS